MGLKLSNGSHNHNHVPFWIIILLVTADIAYMCTTMKTLASSTPET